MIEAVTFDFWNTIAYESPGYLNGLRTRAWERVLSAAGIDVEREGIEAALGEAWGLLANAWVTGDDFHASNAAERAVDLLRTELPDVLRPSLVEAFLTAGNEADLNPTDGIEDCLQSLNAAGIRLGIICDVGFTPSRVLRGVLDRRGLLGFFHGWSFSDEVRAYKPSRAIFEHALQGLGTKPAHAAHVGDLKRTDVAGARAIGMRSVRYRGRHDDTGDGPEADHVLDHHAELAAVLGVTVAR